MSRRGPTVGHLKRQRRLRKPRTLVIKLDGETKIVKRKDLKGDGKLKKAPRTTNPGQLPNADDLTPWREILVHRLHELGFANGTYQDYARYRRSNIWIRRREIYWRTHARTCDCCGGRANELHHRRYERLGCELDEDLNGLCRDCHQAVHIAAKNEGDTVGSLRRAVGVVRRSISKTD